MFNLNFSNIEKRVKSFLDSAFASSMTHTVTYKMLASETYDESTGKKSFTYSEYSIKTVRSDTSLEALKSASISAVIGFSGGEQILMTRYDDLPRDPYSKSVIKDFIIDGTDNYAIKKVVPLFQSFALIQI